MSNKKALVRKFKAMSKLAQELGYSNVREAERAGQGHKLKREFNLAS
ncbi:hypothetical protein HYO65_gp210 [Tenacibaculum phage PTm1]|uniref:Uncharacterized protein n=2 Tax=Shirahamavirus PTm1 TaxID=2846435 RepID=A0A5S9HY83_9CAUD|nr:hypothetical protein HYO65_gp210 [Tenacibaculum phage PTm1]BBI90602.1 hypothetical protein [Tenacibaculum phage PTm1]BBI90909.1 hypothetical protein [Tenacibaculum phage PTm5]